MDLKRADRQQMHREAVKFSPPNEMKEERLRARAKKFSRACAKPLFMVELL
jgi:hypothetical protein